MPNSSSPLRIAYTRKSREAADAQAHSHDQQLQAIRKHYPEITTVFQDSKSGKTFTDRPGFQHMLAWCREHPQARKAPGIIVMWDKSRFGRALVPGTNETDWIAYDRARLDLAEAGWELEFIKGARTGNAVVDRITDVVDDEQSSAYLRKLSFDVRRGMLHAGKAGYWYHGEAPFGAIRRDCRTGQLLPGAGRGADGRILRDAFGAPAEPSVKVPRGSRVVLAPDPQAKAHWEAGAEILMTQGWRALVQYFYDNVPPIRGTHWRQTTLRQVYQQKALIGIVRYTEDGVVHEVNAQWEPIVDPELFKKVNVWIAARKAGKQRHQGEVRCLGDVVCAACGAAYYMRHFNIIRKDGRQYRYYQHPRTTPGHLPPDVEQLAVAAGCRAFCVDAEALEEGIKDLIAQERGSPDWVETMRQLYADSESMEQEAAQYHTQCSKALARAQEALRNNLSALDTAQPSLIPLILERVEAKRKEVQDAEAAIEASSRQIATLGRRRDEAIEVFNETAQLLKAWESGDHRVRRTVMDYWVDHVELTVEGGRRHGTAPASKKWATVWLKTSPAEHPHQFVVGFHGAEHSRHLQRSTPLKSAIPYLITLERDSRFEEIRGRTRRGSTLLQLSR
jgi:DNA invertase Pin-like site-specific DNA recombinase